MSTCANTQMSIHTYSCVKTQDQKRVLADDLHTVTQCRSSLVTQSHPATEYTLASYWPFSWGELKIDLECRMGGGMIGGAGEEETG